MRHDRRQTVTGVEKRRRAPVKFIDPDLIDGPDARHRTPTRAASCSTEHETRDERKRDRSNGRGGSVGRHRVAQEHLSTMHGYGPEDHRETDERQGDDPPEPGVHLGPGHGELADEEAEGGESQEREQAEAEDAAEHRLS